MMWAPIVNNVVACASWAPTPSIWGTSDGSDGFSTPRRRCSAPGATLGIALQALVLVPYARAAGFRFRFRRDLRGVGLGHTLRLGAWTVGFVVANQVSFVVVTRLATGSSTEAALDRWQLERGRGLPGRVPGHPGPARDHHRVAGDRHACRCCPGWRSTARPASMRDELRATAAPGAGRDRPDGGRPRLSRVSAWRRVLFSYGALDGGTAPIGWTLAAFAPGLVLFTVHYLVLRGFYAQEDTRTPFLVQLVVSGRTSRPRSPSPATRPPTRSRPGSRWRTASPTCSARWPRR